MTPQPTPEPRYESGSLRHLDLHLASDLHLTSDQMGDLLATPAGSDLEAAEVHLGSCAPCAAEFASLREALSLFQEASIAHADREFGCVRNLDRSAYAVLPAHRPYSKTLFWVAASAIVMAGFLTLEMRWQRTEAAPPAVAGAASTHTAESDEALLEDINRELSVSVPASMQALVDPTGGASSTDTETSTESSIQTTDQRKD